MNATAKDTKTGWMTWAHMPVGTFAAAVAARKGGR
jgi:hypothetical protein